MSVVRFPDASINRNIYKNPKPIQESPRPVTPPLGAGAYAFLFNLFIQSTTPNQEGIYIPRNSPDPTNRQPVFGAGILRTLVGKVYVNTFDGTVTMTLLKNGAPTLHTVTFNPGETGAKISTLTDVQVVDGDVFSIDVSHVGGTTGLVSGSAAAEFVPFA